MAHISSALFRRVSLSAKSASHLRVCSEISAAAGGSQNVELCHSFRKLALSPQEAQLTAALQKIASPQPSSGIEQYKFPSLLRPLNITVPSLYNGQILDKRLPSTSNIDDKVDPSENTQIREAPSEPIMEKQAARLIVIRRRKMNKHKLKKLRKRMRFDWLKIIQRREYKKEKEFQATQMARVRVADAFDAEEYVTNVLRQTKEKPIPRFYKGKRLPKEIIWELMEKDKQKYQKIDQWKKEQSMRWQDI